MEEKNLFEQLSRRDLGYYSDYEWRCCYCCCFDCFVTHPSCHLVVIALMGPDVVDAAVVAKTMVYRVRKEMGSEL